MATTYEYIIALQDKISGKLQKITGTSFEAVEAMVKLQEKTEKLRGITGDFGNSVFSLRNKIELLKGERDLIDPKNLGTIKQYNAEIGKLERQVLKLETISGSKFKMWAKDAFSQLPGFATNPLILSGTATAAAGKMVLGWEEGMAKINATAQLPKEELDKLGSTIRKLGIESGTNLSKVPDAYEKILSQTNDVTISTQILEKALKASKAGFTDVDTVAAAMAQTLSIVGSKNTNAAEVIDTLFAAKRVGAGEFRDFAQYLPQLVASAQGVNVKFKETAGMFAYFTGKGFNAATASTLLQNAFSLLGRTEVTDNMHKLGVNVFDAQGKIRPMVDLFSDLGNKLNALSSDSERQAWLDSAGIKDMQAKQGFIALAADIDKLRESINATSDPMGEMEKAFDNTRNTTQRLQEAWSKIQGIALSLGGAVSTVLNPALTVLAPILNSVSWVFTAIGQGFSLWVDALKSSNPVLQALAIGLNAVSAALAVNYVLHKNFIPVAKLKTAWDWIQNTTMGILTGSIWAQNAAWLANPIGWVIGLITLLVGGVILAWQKFEGFRKAILGVWEVFKHFGSIIKDLVIDRIKSLISGIAGLGKMIGFIFKGEWSKAWETGKQAVKDLSGIDAAKKAWEKGKQTGEAWNKGIAKGTESWQKTQAAKKKTEAVTAPAKAGKSTVVSQTTDLAPTGSMAETASGINSGARPTNINISIRNLVEKFEIHTSGSVGETTGEIEDKIMSTLLRLLNSANAVAFKGA